MLTNYCYQTDIRFQSLNCPVPSPLLCGLDIGYSGIKIQSPCNASIIPSIVVKARNDSPLLINGEDIRYRDEKGQMWYVGSLAKKTLLYGSTAIKSTTLLGRQRVQSEEFLVQSRIGFFFAKLRGLPEGGYDMDERPLKVQTGLPPEFIVQDTETLLQRLTGEHSFYVRIGKRPWLNVKVKLERRDIHVCKQPFGTLMSSVISEGRRHDQPGTSEEKRPDPGRRVPYNGYLPFYPGRKRRRVADMGELFHAGGVPAYLQRYPAGVRK